MGVLRVDQWRFKGALRGYSKVFQFKSVSLESRVTSRFCDSSRRIENLEYPRFEIFPEEFDI